MPSSVLNIYRLGVLRCFKVSSLAMPSEVKVNVTPSQAPESLITKEQGKTPIP